MMPSWNSRSVSAGRVPARIVLGEPTLLVVQAAYANELRSRLGW